MLENKKNVEKEEIDYKELYLNEKLLKLQIESNLIQFKFQQLQEQMQLVNIEITSYKKSKMSKKLYEADKFVPKLEDEMQKEESLQPE